MCLSICFLHTILLYFILITLQTAFMKNARILLLVIGMAIIGSIACAYKITTVTTFYKTGSTGGCNASINTLLVIANPFDPDAFTTNLSKFSTNQPCIVTYVKGGA